MRSWWRTAGLPACRAGASLVTRGFGAEDGWGAGRQDPRSSQLKWVRLYGHRWSVGVAQRDEFHASDPQPIP